jgi:hypothetical protein
VTTSVVEYPVHNKVQTAMEMNPAMLRQNHIVGWFLCQRGIARNLQTRWRRKGSGVPLSIRCRQPTPE